MIRGVIIWAGHPDRQRFLMWSAIVVLYHWLGFLSWYVATQIK